MTNRDVHCEKELASYIRAGAERRPEQAYGDYFKGEHASCALGAAYDGMYRVPGDPGATRPTKDLDRRLSLKQLLARQQLVGHHTKRPDIRSRVGGQRNRVRIRWGRIR